MIFPVFFCSLNGDFWLRSPESDRLLMTNRAGADLGKRNVYDTYRLYFTMSDTQEPDVFFWISMDNPIYNG